MRARRAIVLRPEQAARKKAEGTANEMAVLVERTGREFGIAVSVVRLLGLAAIVLACLLAACADLFRQATQIVVELVEHLGAVDSGADFDLPLEIMLEGIKVSIRFDGLMSRCTIPCS